MEAKIQSAEQVLQLMWKELVEIVRAGRDGNTDKVRMTTMGLARTLKACGYHKECARLEREAT